MSVFNTPLIWENSWHLRVSSNSPPEMTSDEQLKNLITYWWRVATQIWVKFLIGRSKFPSRYDQCEAIASSGQWHVICMEFLRSFLRRHFAGKPVVALWNFGCFLRLTVFRWRDCTVIKQLFAGKSMPKEIKSHSPLVHRTTQRLRMDYDTIRFLPGNWRERTCIIIWLQAAMKPAPEQ